MGKLISSYRLLDQLMETLQVLEAFGIADLTVRIASVRALSRLSRSCS